MSLSGRLKEKFQGIMKAMLDKFDEEMFKYPGLKELDDKRKYYWRKK